MIRAPSVAIRSIAIIGAMLVGVSGVQCRPPEAAPDPQALLAEGLYEQAEQAARARVEHLRSVQGDDSLQVAIASDGLGRALLLNGKGAAAETLSITERTLQAKEARLDPMEPKLAPSLLNVGMTLLARDEWDRAIAAIERAVALRERDAGPASVDVAEALDHLATAQAAAGRYDEALGTLERSLPIKEASLDGWDAGIARTLETRAFAWQMKGDYEQAGIAIRRAEEIQRRSNAAHPAYIDTLFRIGEQFFFEGRFLQSRDAFERAVSLAERTLRADHPALTRSLQVLAGTVGDLGDLEQARTLKQRALAIAERNFGPDHHQTAQYIHSLGLAEFDQGEFPTARGHLERALAIFEARYGEWHDFVATAHHNLARVEASLGDYARARREQARAAAIWNRLLGPDHPYIAVALTELATVYREQGAPTESVPLLERALVIRERRLGPQHREVARTLADLSSVLVQTGGTARARTLAARALDIWEQLDAPDVPDHATVLALSAELQANGGDWGAARTYYEQALAIRRKVFGPSHPLFADAEAGLALALAGTGNSDVAFSAAVNAETTGRKHLRLMLRSLPERQSLNYAASRPRGLDLMLSLIGSAPRAAEAAFDGLIRSRALVLDEVAARQTAGRPADGSEDPLRRAMVSAQQRLANLIVRGPDQLTAAQYATVIDEARRESEAAERVLVERSSEFRAEQNRTQLALSDVTASLPADSALVSFVRYERTTFVRPVGKTPSGATSRASTRTVLSYLAFVVRPGQPPIALPLGSAQAIDRAVARWRADIAAGAVVRAGIASAGSGSAARLSGAGLRKLVWDPLTRHLSDANRIFVVPDGTLSLVPFVALPVGDRSYVLERAPVIHHLSAERDIVAPSDKAASAARGLLALGGPAFDDRTLFAATRTPAPLMADAQRNATGSLRASGAPCAGFRTVKFQPLTGTEQEVRELSSVWGVPSNLGSEPARVLLDRDASESAFKQNAPRSRVLHLATHGFFLSDACASSAPAGTRAVGGLTSSSGRQETSSTENPLLLSGLALAGANHRNAAGPDEDDGILTAEEVASLDLSGVEWAVLSACDTGLGEIKAGEGVFGLRRAFQIAGARTVIMSLWSVDDQATREWMRALYEGRFQKRLSTADAVHAASLAVLRDRRAKGLSTHPFYWAAFVAAGDWR